MFNTPFAHQDASGGSRFPSQPGLYHPLAAQSVPRAMPAEPSAPSPSPSSSSSAAELFVGNLSFFCEERHVFELFHSYGCVENVRIVRNDGGKRSLMFGFVSMSSAQEAREMCRLLDGHLFMGRNMKVQLSDRKQHSDSAQAAPQGHQVHVSFYSHFLPDHIVRPSEILLRKYFLRFGSVIDVAVREYVQHSHPLRQDGYGFVTFEDALSVQAATAQNVPHVVEGISLVCTVTHNAASSSRRRPASVHAQHMLVQHSAFLPPPPHAFPSHNTRAPHFAHPLSHSRHTHGSHETHSSSLISQQQYYRQRHHSDDESLSLSYASHGSHGSLSGSTGLTIIPPSSSLSLSPLSHSHSHPLAQTARYRPHNHSDNCTVNITPMALNAHSHSRVRMSARDMHTIPDEFAHSDSDSHSHGQQFSWLDESSEHTHAAFANYEYEYDEYARNHAHTHVRRLERERDFGSFGALGVGAFGDLSARTDETERGDRERDGARLRASLSLGSSHSLSGISSEDVGETLANETSQP